MPLVDRIRPLPFELRRPYILGKAPHFSKLEWLMKNPTEANAWHADHIVAVADGGGECTLENFQTLCIVCHAKVTAEQHRRRTTEDIKLKTGLLRTMKELLERSERWKRRRKSYTEGDAGISLMDFSSESDNDEDLLDINVAGNDYSTSGVEVLSKHGCKSILQPNVTENLGTTHNVRSSVEVRGNTELLTEHTSILQLLSLDSHESTHKVRISLDFPKLESYKSTDN